MGKLCNTFKGWNCKEKIFAPIFVNLLSAFLIFSLALCFKEKIYDLFGIDWGKEEYPLYCIIEPYNDNGRLLVDLFVINLTMDRYEEEDLENIIKKIREEKGILTTPKIQIKMKEEARGEIIEINHHDEFNNEKGKISILQISKKHCEISVKEIEGKGILKLTIITSIERDLNRNAKASVPFKIIYPGRLSD